MSDVPASLTTGEIIRRLRERRGLTRPVLAGLVDYSSDWLKRIEAGQRGIGSRTRPHCPGLERRRPVHAYRRGPAAICLGMGRAGSSGRDQGPSDRRSLDIHQADRETEPDFAALAADVGRAWRDWHMLPNNHTTVARVLPNLIMGLEQATVVLDGDRRRAAHTALASAYGLAQHLAVDVVEPEVGRVIADRATRAAQAAIP